MADSDNSTITTGELHRAVGLIRTDIKDLKSDIEGKPTNKDIAYLENRIKDLEDSAKWTFRMAVTSLATGGIAIISALVNRILM